MLNIMKICLFSLAMICAGSTLANTQNSLTMIKKTVLTGKDAKNFNKKFGDKQVGNQTFTFKCQDAKCTIYNSRSGFSGDIAKKLLHNRKKAKFVSNDRTFTLECGKYPVNYCNVIQKKVILN